MAIVVVVANDLFLDKGNHGPSYASIHSDIDIFTPDGFSHTGDGVCHTVDRQLGMPDTDEKGNTDKFNGRDLLPLTLSRFAGFNGMEGGCDGGIVGIEHRFQEGETSGDV